MDEPTSALDPISTSRIEDLAMELKKEYTIIMVTHNMQQATRISDKTAFFLLGEMVEYARYGSAFLDATEQTRQKIILQDVLDKKKLRKVRFKKHKK